MVVIPRLLAMWGHIHHGCFYNFYGVYYVNAYSTIHKSATEDIIDMSIYYKHDIGKGRL